MGSRAAQAVGCVGEWEAERRKPGINELEAERRKPPGINEWGQKPTERGKSSL